MLVRPVQVSQNEDSRVLEAQSDFIFTLKKNLASDIKTF